MNLFQRMLVLSVPMIGLILGGCGGDSKPFILSYQTAAMVEVPTNIRKVAVSEFTTKSGQKSYASIAADDLVSNLDATNSKFKRFELVDRRRLDEVMKERDLQIAISDSSSALKVGKLAEVHGIIYGSIETYAKTQHKSHPSIGLDGRPTVKTTLQTTCGVAINFTMDDVNTGKTITSRMFKADYDSEKAGSGSMGSKIASGMGFGSDNTPAVDKIMQDLIDECVKQFVAVISTHDTQVKVQLESGKSKYVKEGNEFAMSGEHADALRKYQQAIQEKPNDDVAYFQAGLMYEGMKDFRNAEAMYQKALDVKVDKKYVEARARVRLLVGDSAPVKP